MAPTAETVPDELVLALIALLLLWLLARIDRRARQSKTDAPGRTRVRVRGRRGVQRIDLLPRRPIAFGAAVTVPAGPDDDRTCAVDLTQLTCDCRDFRQNRAHLPPDALGRVCAHLSSALAMTGATSAMDQLLRAIVEAGAARMSYYQFRIGSGRVVAVGHTPGTERLDVFLGTRRGGGPYRRYEYSRAARRWCCVDPPPDRGEIAAAIVSLPLDDRPTHERLPVPAS
jgi:hypothetical protein